MPTFRFGRADNGINDCKLADVAILLTPSVPRINCRVTDLTDNNKLDNCVRRCTGNEILFPEQTPDHKHQHNTKMGSSSDLDRDLDDTDAEYTEEAE
jgi:hypothetical protein